MDKHGAPDFDHMIYVRVTEACNAYCEHCFIPKNPKTLTLGDIPSVAKSIIDISKENETVLVQLHGGEPTLLGGKFLDAFASGINDIVRDRNIIFSMQTNLLSIDDSLIAFVQKFCKNTLGVSWDTGIRHIRSKSDNSNQKFENKFWSNFQKLISNNISPFVVMTVTKQFLDRFVRNESLIEFCANNSIKHLHLEKLTKSGYAVDNWKSIGVSNLEYSAGMSYIFQEYSYESNHGSDLHVSPFDDLEQSVSRFIAGNKGGAGCLSGLCDTKFHTHDANGYSNGCTALTADVDREVSIVRFVEIQSVRGQRTIPCESCVFKGICNSGCLKVEINDGSGECSGNKILFNTIARKLLKGNHDA